VGAATENAYLASSKHILGAIRRDMLERQRSVKRHSHSFANVDIDGLRLQ